VDWTVSRRITTGFSIGLALMLVIAGVGIYALLNSERAYNIALQKERSVLVTALETKTDFQEANLGYLFFVLEPNDRWAARRDSSVAVTRAKIAQLRDSASTSEARAVWLSAAALVDRWDPAARKSMAAARAGRRDEALRIRDVEIAPIRDELRRTLDNGMAIGRQHTDSIIRDARSSATRLEWTLIIGSLVALIIGIAAAVLLNRAVTLPLQKTSAGLASSAAEILAATTQQASGATETSAAVTETVTTVDEVAQTAEHAAERARAVSTLAQRAAEIGGTGRTAVEKSVAGMKELKTQVESISESILALAEQAQAIGEIIATVTEIAEQTNLLALNAAVEAARAGDQGRGFAVVAAEVRSLADEAKKATVQVRQILGEIQRATNAAVMNTEQGTKFVAAGAKQAAEAGETIRALSDAVTEASQAAVQIVASASQQAAGMAQIRQAMANVHEATQQNLAATRQAEAAAQDLNTLGVGLLELVGSNGTRPAKIKKT
jgi:methyl-accepting chemotaxis protein